jgi:nucleotide-binding universal stress UspA family protein
MATSAAARPRVQAVSSGYRRLLVPMTANAESERAVEVACRLASERHASVEVLTVVEISPLLPLDARMDEEELDARRLHERAEEIADTYGVSIVPRRLRARQAAEAILDELADRDFDLVVVGASRRRRVNRRGSPFGRTVLQVLRKSARPVLLVASPFPG